MLLLLPPWFGLWSFPILSSSSVPENDSHNPYKTISTPATSPGICSDLRRLLKGVHLTKNQDGLGSARDNLVRAPSEQGDTPTLAWSNPASPPPLWVRRTREWASARPFEIIWLDGGDQQGISSKRTRAGLHQDFGL